MRCSNCLSCETSFVLNKQKTDKAERILILEVTFDTDQHILMDLYNAYTETKQIKFLWSFQASFLKVFNINQNKRIIICSDFNIFFNPKLEAKGGKSLPKNIHFKITRHERNLGYL